MKCSNFPVVIFHQIICCASSMDFSFICRQLKWYVFGSVIWHLQQTLLSIACHPQEISCWPHLWTYNGNDDLSQGLPRSEKEQLANHLTTLVHISGLAVFTGKHSEGWSFCKARQVWCWWSNWWCQQCTRNGRMFCSFIAIYSFSVSHTCPIHTLQKAINSAAMHIEIKSMKLKIKINGTI